MSWTDERIERLKSLQGQGLSASQIAADLGGFHDTIDGGRSAVIGKIHRLGIGRGRKATKPPKPREPPRASSRVTAARSKSLDEAYADPEPTIDDGFRGEPSMIDLAIPVEQRKTMRQLTDDDCKWPVGDPQAADFFFCGGPKLGGLPYCSYHCRVAYDSAATRRSLNKPSYKGA